MTGVALTLLVVFAASPGAKRSLEGCEVLGPALGLERIIRCGGFVVDVYPPIPAALEKDTVNAVAHSYAVVPGEKEVISVAQIELGSTKLTALRYLRRRNDGNSDLGLVTSVPAGKGQVRLAHCTHGLEPPCYRVLEYLLTRVPPPSAPAPAGPPELGGRALEVPKGCTRKGPRQLACGPTELTWAPLFPGAPDTLADVEPLVRRAHLHLGPLEGADRYCKLGGAEALCRVATVKQKDGRKRFLVFGFAAVGGAPHFFSCASAADPSQRIPAPCAQVMALQDPEKAKVE